MLSRKTPTEGWGDENVPSWEIWLMARVMGMTGKAFGHSWKGHSLISTSKWVWNRPSMSHDWKVAGFREDTISMLRIWFSDCCDWILWKYKKITKITKFQLVLLHRVLDYLERWYRVSAWKMVSYHLDPAYQMAIDPLKVWLAQPRGILMIFLLKLHL